MSFEDEDDESFEHTLLVVREVAVFKIPPRSTSGGYKCGEWLQSDKIWTGRLRVVSCKDRCEIVTVSKYVGCCDCLMHAADGDFFGGRMSRCLQQRIKIRLEDPNSSELFAACFVPPGQRETSVETVLDSSRYFVLKIEDGSGKHAFIGLGFSERNEAFDFNVALSDHDKYVKRETENDAVGGSDDSLIEVDPVVNHRLKEGETIKINVKPKQTSGTGMLSAAGLSGAAKPKSPVALSLAPPPGLGKLKSALPPPPNDPVAARIKSDNAFVKKSDPLSDLSQIERNLPAASGSGSSTKTNAVGWAAF